MPYHKLKLRKIIEKHFIFYRNNTEFGKGVLSLLDKLELFIDEIPAFAAIKIPGNQPGIHSSIKKRTVSDNCLLL